MKIKMIERASGPKGSFKPGQVLEVGKDISAEKAKEWVDGHYAVVVDASSQEPEPEPDTDSAPEVPAGRGRRGRKG